MAFPLKMLLQPDGHLTSCDILHTVAGAIIFDVYENQDARLVSLQIPEHVLRTFPGPAYGPLGLRERAGFAADEPAFGTILKPTAGITPDEVGKLVAEAAECPLFLFVKEDEDLYPEPGLFARRASACREAVAAIERAKEKRQRQGPDLRPAHHRHAARDAGDAPRRDRGRGHRRDVQRDLSPAARCAWSARRRSTCPHPPAIYGHNAGIGVKTRGGIWREVIDLLARLDGIDFRQTAPVRPGPAVHSPLRRGMGGVRGDSCPASCRAFRPTMIARAGGLDQGNIILNLADAERRGLAANILFLAGSAINSIKNAQGRPDPRLGAEAMLQALEVHRSGELAGTSIDEPLARVGGPRAGKKPDRPCWKPCDNDTRRLSNEPQSPIKIVEKPWGRELWVAHTDKYAFKIIEIKAGHAIQPPVPRPQARAHLRRCRRAANGMGKRDGRNGHADASSGRSRREQAGAKTPRHRRRGRAAVGSQHARVGRRGAGRGRLPTASRHGDNMAEKIMCFWRRCHRPRACRAAGLAGRLRDRSSSTRSRRWSMPSAAKAAIRSSSTARRSQEIVVSGYRVYHSLDRAAIAEEIRDAGLVLTAVFDQNLPDVAQTIALGISACARAGRTTPLNCIACENMMDSSTQLGQHVAATPARAPTWPGAKQYVGFPDCMISRVVPRPEPDPLLIVAEDYNEWTARAEAFRGDKPAALSALELVDNQIGPAGTQALHPQRRPRHLRLLRLSPRPPLYP